MTYQKHRRELLKDKAVRAEHDKLRPEYELTRCIIEQRIKKKMTQVEVAKKTGMPQSTISRIEGLTHGIPCLTTLKKIAKAPGRGTDYHAQGKENCIRRDVKNITDDLSKGVLWNIYYFTKEAA